MGDRLRKLRHCYEDPTPKLTAEDRDLQLKAEKAEFMAHYPRTPSEEAQRAINAATRQAFEKAAVEGESRECACHYRPGKHSPSCVLSLAEWCRARALAKEKPDEDHR